MATWIGIGASATSVGVKGISYFAKKDQATLQNDIQ